MASISKINFLVKHTISYLYFETSFIYDFKWNVEYSYFLMCVNKIKLYTYESASLSMNILSCSCCYRTAKYLNWYLRVFSSKTESNCLNWQWSNLNYLIFWIQNFWIVTIWRWLVLINLCISWSNESYLRVKLFSQ